MIGTIEEIINEIGSIPEGLVKLDGYDDCICGIVERYGMDSVLLYDTNLIINKMMEEDGMEQFEAIEYFDFNIMGAWFSEGTPCFTSYLR